MVTACINCSVSRVYARDRCHACYRYYLRHGSDRPQAYFIRSWGRYECKPHWCKNCGSLRIIANYLCNACYVYYRRHHKNRPRHLWDVEAKCKTCGVSLTTIQYKRNGYCDPCYHYICKGQERSKELWGIGVYGWCDCGRPANYQKDGFNLCTICKE